jgi:hypothetical protein
MKKYSWGKRNKEMNASPPGMVGIWEYLGGRGRRNAKLEARLG